MATDPKKQQAQQASGIPGMDDFDKIAGTEVFTDRPIVKFAELGKDARVVMGWLVHEEQLNLPKPRPQVTKDGQTVMVSHWDAFVIHLTAPTNAIKNDEVVSVAAGREVFIPVNPKNDFLRSYLGKNEMHEVAIIGDGQIDTKNNPMQSFRHKFTGKTQVRAGAFLIGGPGQVKLLKDGTTLASALDEIEGRTPAAVNSATATAP